MSSKLSKVLRIRLSKGLHEKLDILRGEKTLSEYIRSLLAQHTENENTAHDYEDLRFRELVDSIGRLYETEKGLEVISQALQNNEVWTKYLVQDLLYYVARSTIYMEGFANLQLTKENCAILEHYVAERSKVEKKKIEEVFK